MPKLNPTLLRRHLTEALGLDSPTFRIHRIAGRLGGSIISQTFRGIGDGSRQERIWDALESRFGPEAVRDVGMLLAYTPEEWDAGIDAAKRARAI